MEFSVKVDTAWPGWSIVCIEGSQVGISKLLCISVPEDCFDDSKK